MSQPGRAQPAEATTHAAGRGTVLFLHAFPLDREMWADQAQAVQDAGWMFAAPDFPGFGDAPLAGAETLEEYAERAAGVLESVGATRAVVVGLSMGGYAAFRLLERRPELVRALVLADTRAGPDSPEAAEGRRRNAERTEREGTGWTEADLLPKLLGPDADAAVRDQVREMIGRAKPEAVAAALRALAARPDSTGLLAGISVPTLVIVGSDDAITPPDEARRMADAIPGARLEVIPVAGHLANLENPEAFDRVLLEFLNALPAEG